jgi:hypothetical protein
MSYPSGEQHNHQSIPLQDLNRPPDEDDGTAPQEHRRTLSDRGRNLLRHTGAIATGHYRDLQYAPIAESSPSPTRHVSRPYIDTTVGAQQSGIRRVEDDDVGSPIDAGAFQAAIGFGMDMNFQGDTSPPLTPPDATPGSSEDAYGQYGHPYQARSTSEEQEYFSPVYDDTARLTDAQHLAPISGAAAPLSPHSQDRSSFQSVRFLSPGDMSPVARDSDNMGQVEAARGSLRDSTGRKRSLSPGQIASPLNRAGTIMRNMSQRVVNVSNDSQVAERSLLRKSTVHSRMHEPPSFPALPEYATDGPASPSPTNIGEKPPSPVIRSRKPSVQWHRPRNPLRGKSLGIFPADSTIRMKLCDVLVHPATEPLLLVLIVVQTVLLAVDASSKATFDPERTNNVHKFSPIDYALLGLFIIYTIEVVIRIIVSGFIINPVEYSTINRQVGLREAVMMKANRLFGGLERQPSQRRSGTKTDPVEPQQPSVLRTFTTAQIHEPEGPRDHRELQRTRLAHRAYLRHSFNRTDFLAVIAFWISFLLGLLDLGNTRVILVFDMLSCLRIIRLLNLTSGTSVGCSNSIDANCN